MNEAHSEARTSDAETRLNLPTENDDVQESDIEGTVSLINHVAYNYVALFIVAVGIVGNLLNLIVLTRPKLKGVMYVYLLGLAVSNLCVLIIAIPGTIPFSNTNKVKSDLSQIILFVHDH